MKNIIKKNIVFLSTAILLSACGGGDDAPASIVETPENIYGTVKSISPNSITVNGFLLEADAAAVTYANNTLQLSEIKPGMRVEIDTNKRGGAENIELAPNVVGEVSAVGAASITVNGAILSTNKASEFSVGDWAFFNGYLAADGQWIASAVFPIEPFEFAEIEGVITQLDDSRTQFYIGSTLVNYADANIDHDETLTNGAWVEVEGSFSTNVFNAVDVDIENDAKYEGVDLEGVISWVNQDKSSIELNGRTRVAITDATKYEDGGRGDLTEGKIVDVDIIKGASGLVATEVEFEGASDNVPSATLPSFELEGEAFAAGTQGSFQINGYHFTVDARTEFDDGLTLDSIINEEIEIEGVEVVVDGNRTFLVKEIERVDINSLEINLQGLVKEKGEIWGYGASDDSLNSFAGQYVEIECMKDGVAVKLCRVDD